MPTALSSTDADASYVAASRLASARRAVVDVAILFQFRKQAVRRRHLSRVLSPGVRGDHPGSRGRARLHARRPRGRSGVRHPAADSDPDGRHPGPEHGLGDRVRWRTRADLPRPGRPAPDQPDHRPPRRPAARTAQHRVDDPGLGAARGGLVLGGARPAGAGRGGDGPLDRDRDGARPGHRLVGGGRPARARRHRGLARDAGRGGAGGRRGPAHRAHHARAGPDPDRVVLGRRDELADSPGACGRPSSSC